jgi:hypothetical protein
VVDILIDEIRDQEKEWMRLQDEQFKNMKIRFNFTNTFAIIFKIIETLTLATVAFRKGIYSILKPTYICGQFFLIGN